MAGQRPKVSDHALVRFFERRHGLSFAKTRQEILSPEVKAAIKAGAKSVKTEMGTFRINGNCVVTFIGKRIK